MTTTLETIKHEQQRLAEMIAGFEAQAKIAASYPITVELPKLNPGEHYLGAILSADSTKRHHVILLPGDNDGASWQEQMDWARSIGGDLPDRVEQALLFACMKDQFKEASYWSNTRHGANSNNAWCQYFDDGGQIISSKSAELRARAVRRLVIQ